MAETKGDAIRRLLAKNDVISTPPKSRLSNTIQWNYLNQLENNITATRTFIEQANEAIRKLEESVKVNSETERPRKPTLEAKRRVLALHDAYRRLAYTNDKNDSIGIASASKITKDLLREQKEANSWLVASKDEYKESSASLEALISDYREILLLAEEKLASNPRKIEVTTKKMAQIAQEELTLDGSIRVIDEQLAEAALVQKSLASHLKRVIMKFTAFLDFKNESALDERALKDTVIAIYKLIDKLVEKLVRTVSRGDDPWTEHRPGPDEYIVKVMLRNELVVSRNDSTSEVMFLKLREFGVGF